MGGFSIDFWKRGSGKKCYSNNSLVFQKVGLFAKKFLFLFAD